MDNEPKIIGQSIILDGINSCAKSAVKKILELLKLEVIDDETREETANMYCYVSPNAGLPISTLNQDYFDFDKVYKTAKKIAEKGKGRMLLITSCMTDMTVNIESSKQKAYESFIKTLWNNMASEMAPLGVTCNIINVGYAPVLGNSLDEEQEAVFFRRLTIRHEVSDDDIKNSMQFLLSSDADYIAGYTLQLDGGLSFLKVITKNKGAGKGVRKNNGETKNTFDLKGKTAIVIGCSSGIGREAALKLANRGADIALAARRVDMLKELADEIEKTGVRSTVIQCDVTVKEDLKKVIESTLEKFGTIDILVYTAGQGYMTNDLEQNDDLQNMMNVNFKGYVNACLMAIQYWRDNGKCGSIVGISTIDIMKVPSVNLGAYSTSKAAMSQFSRNIALICSKYGIRVNCVVPGYINTDMVSWTTDSYRDQWVKQIPMHRLGEAKDISGTIAFLASSAANYITGAEVLVDGGFTLGYLPELS